MSSRTFIFHGKRSKISRWISIWRKLIPSLMDDFERFMTSVKEVMADVVEKWNCYSCMEQKMLLNYWTFDDNFNRCGVVCCSCSVTKSCPIQLKTNGTPAHQASSFFSQSFLKFMSIDFVMLSNHLWVSKEDSFLKCHLLLRMMWILLNK